MKFGEGLWRQLPTWLQGDGPESDVVVCTRARLARNLAAERFPHACQDDELDALRGRLNQQVGLAKSFSQGWQLDLAQLAERERAVLRELHLASADLLRSPQGRGLVISGDRAVAVMVNEEDHLRIQAFRPSLDPVTACQDALAIDQELENELEFAFSEEFGYLTACPTNVGTALRLSVLIHLPGLVLGGEIDKVFNSLRQLQFAVRGLDGEGSPVRGALFQISNLSSLGRDESDLATDFDRHVAKVVHYERLALKRLYERDPTAIDDLAHRALAVLQQARIISGQEAFDRLSQVRMGVVLGVLPAIPMTLLNRALVQHQSAHLQLAAGQIIPPAARGRLRADFMRATFAEV